MLEINDQGTQAQLLMQLLEAIESGRAQELAEVGIPGATQDMLRQLKAYEVVRLMRRNLGFVAHVNANQITHEVRTLRDQMQRQVNLEYFVARAAPGVLIQRLFRLQRDELTSVTRALAKHQQPDTKHLSLRLRSQIEAAWLDLGRTHAKGSIEHWMALAEQFQEINLAGLHSVVASFERLGK